MVAKSRFVRYKERARTEANAVLFSTLSQMFCFTFQPLTVTTVTPIVQLEFSESLPATPKHYGVFDVFADFQKFCKLEKLGSH